MPSGEQILVLPTDINYLDASLGCDPRANENCCGQCNGYRVCCDGNIVNELGDRATMSHGGVLRGGFDENSLNHLKTFDELGCD